MRMSPETREAINETLRNHPEVAVAYLFGSAARGDGSALSDIDVGILWGSEPECPLRARARLSEDLARAASGAPVDVVCLGEAPPALVGRVVRDGEVLICRDETRRIRFEIDGLRRDLDTVRLRHLYDTALATANREGRFYGRS